MFTTKEIIWAKTKGYPWWPAQICKLPTVDHNYFKVSFLGQNNHAVLEPKAIRKYYDYYEDLKTKKFKGLQNSIDLANIQMQKRKSILLETQKQKKIQLKPVEKTKKIAKKGKKKKKLKRIGLKGQSQANKLQAVQIQQQKNQTFQEKSQKIDKEKQKQFKSQSESICVSAQFQSEEIQINELQYLRNVDRKKIQSTEEQLVTFITKFNANNYEKERQCYQVVLKIEKQEFKPQQILQSKITNMLSYIQKKLGERIGIILKKDEFQRIKCINNKLKQSVLTFLFDCCYYEQYLKRMQKSVTLIKQKEQKQKKSQSKGEDTNNRKYKRKYLHKKELNKNKNKLK